MTVLLVEGEEDDDECRVWDGAASLMANIEPLTPRFAMSCGYRKGARVLAAHEVPHLFAMVGREMLMNFVPMQSQHPQLFLEVVRTPIFFPKQWQEWVTKISKET